MFARILAPAALALSLGAGAAEAAEGDLARLETALRIGEVFAVMSEEGLAYGLSLIHI